MAEVIAGRFYFQPIAPLRIRRGFAFADAAFGHPIDCDSRNRRVLRIAHPSGKKAPLMGRQHHRDLQALLARERSRDPKGVLAEAESLAQAGYKQVTLLGQNVNSYKHGGYDFADLVQMVADAPGIERVRFTSPHPKDFPESLLRVIGEHPNVCHHIHLPMQSGSDRVLELMRRTYTVESFKALAARMRETIPGVAISTDIIVGFPTESQRDFEDTCRIMEEMRFDFAFIFKYSERKGTWAERNLEEDVTPEQKTERIVHLVELQKRITGEKNQDLAGQTFEVLVEETAKKQPDCLIGRTDTFKPTVFPRERYEIGDLVDVKIEKSRGGTLFGRAEGYSPKHKQSGPSRERTAGNAG